MSTKKEEDLQAVNVEFKNDSSLFDKENIPASNWFRFNKVGDKVSGELVSVKEQPSTTVGFPDQRVFTLRTKDGKLMNVGIKVTSSYLMARTESVAAGDSLGFEFTKEIPPKVKGHHPAKSIEVYHRKQQTPVSEE